MVGRRQRRLHGQERPCLGFGRRAWRLLHLPLTPPPRVDGRCRPAVASPGLPHGRRGCGLRRIPLPQGSLASDHPPQVMALRRGDWVKLICGASFESLILRIAHRICSKPCEKVCPADAILLKCAMVGGEQTQSDLLRGKHEDGVITERCYGCGPYLQVCPYDRIS